MADSSWFFSRRFSKPSKIIVLQTVWVKPSENFQAVLFKSFENSFLDDFSKTISKFRDGFIETVCNLFIYFYKFGSVSVHGFKTISLSLSLSLSLFGRQLKTGFGRSAGSGRQDLVTGESGFSAGSGRSVV
jgi:hypothetical protein